MTDLAYTGFRFRWDRPDINAPNGVLSMHVLAVARSLSKAQQVVADSVKGSLTGVSLTKSGPDVLEEAKQRGIGQDQAMAL